MKKKGWAERINQHALMYIFRNLLYNFAKGGECYEGA